MTMQTLGAFAVPLIVLSWAAGEAWAASASVRPHEGRPALFLDGEPVPPFAYMAYLGETRWYREMADAGIHLYCFPAYLGDRGINPRSGIGPFRPPLWRGEDDFDFTSMEGDLDSILAADPDARTVVRLYLDPPAWWEAAHPEACCLLPDGTTFRQCFASQAWREATADAVRAVMAWIEASPYVDHIVGIHVAAGGTEEWFYHFGDAFHDLNPVRTEAFRAWLRKAYRDDEDLLRDAWHDPQASFAEATPADISGPTGEARWRDPNAERPVLDTLQFHCETMAENVAYFCQVVKETSRGKMLTGAFFGYHYFVNDPRRGHCALGKLLDCPDLDYLSSPNAYNRVMGEDWPPMVALASVRRHGKLWLAENDTRTFKTTLLKDRAPSVCPPGQYDSGVWLGPESAGDSVALLKKNTARMLAGGYGGWWFDMWGGWFSDERLMTVLRQTQKLGALDIAEPGPAMAPAIAVVADETLSFHDASFGALAERIFGNRYPLAKSGAPYDLYLTSDLALVDATAYRAVWLLGPPSLSGAEKHQVTRLRDAGATVMWTRPEGTTVYRPEQASETHPGKTAWTASELRALWKEAGVHVYLDADDVLYAGNGWIGIHSLPGGERTLRLPFPGDLSDAFTGERLGTGAGHIDLTLEPRSTTLLRITRTASP